MLQIGTQSSAISQTMEVSSTNTTRIAGAVSPSNTGSSVPAPTIESLRSISCGICSLNTSHKLRGMETRSHATHITLLGGGAHILHTVPVNHALLTY